MAKIVKNNIKVNDFRLASLAFIGIVALIVTGVVGAASSKSTATSFASTLDTVFSTGDWDTALSNLIHADVSQSVTLPNGSILWVFGDTTQVNGVSTSGAYGYPHDTIATQAPNTLTFTAVPGTYGYGWQQVPNWSDGSYFWMSTPIVYNGHLYILGERVKGVSPFTVVGDYVAVFNAKTMAFQQITQIPDGSTGNTAWGGVASTSSGWWITGTHAVSCSYATDCKVGDLAFVPYGGLTVSNDWKVYNNVIPASMNVGTSLALLKTGSGWDIFTKQGDSYGGTNIEKLTSTSIPGSWEVTNTWSAPSPSGTVTYGVAVHPEQTSPLGQVLVSYDVNGINADYHPLFEYLPQ
jgi:hypothetical protein